MRRCNVLNRIHVTHLPTEQPAVDHLILQCKTDLMQRHAMNSFLQLPRLSLIFNNSNDAYCAATTLAEKPKMTHQMQQHPSKNG